MNTTEDRIRGLPTSILIKLTDNQALARFIADNEPAPVGQEAVERIVKWVAAEIDRRVPVP
jgi:hypothetical protein